MYTIIENLEKNYKGANGYWVCVWQSINPNQIIIPFQHEVADKSLYTLFEYLRERFITDLTPIRVVYEAMMFRRIEIELDKGILEIFLVMGLPLQEIRG